VRTAGHPCNSLELQGCPAVRTRTSKKEKKEVCHQLDRGTGGILELALKFVKFLKFQVFPPPLGVPLGWLWQVGARANLRVPPGVVEIPGIA